MRFSIGSAGLLLLVAPAVLAQNNLPNLSTLSQPDGAQATSSARPSSTPPPTSSPSPSPSPSPQSTDATPTIGGFPTVSRPGGIVLSGLPTIAGVGIPNQKVPDTAGAAFMQKSDLPDGTVFICVGAILAALAAAVLAWRGLVVWSLHRSVKRAATAQNMADMKAMSAVPGKKRGMYNVVGANSTMSLDHLAAAPIGSSKVTKPYAQKPGGTPPNQSNNSLFFSPTAGGAGGMRDSMSRSSTYLPAGYYPTGNAAPAGGSPLASIGGNGQNLSVASLTTPGNRYSHRSSNLPQTSPSLPPSRDGHSIYNRNSVATLGTPGNTRSGVFGYNENMSQTSLNVPGGNAAGGRAPSAYLEDLFENHGNGPRERF